MIRRINELQIGKYVELRDFTDRDELFSEIDVSNDGPCIVTGKQIGRASCRERVYVLV